MEEKQIKTGILGGTFNPVHNGHIHLAENALHAAGLDRILFVPSGISYMKDQHEILPARERVELVKLAIQDHPRFFLSTIETDRECNSYTHETILALQKKHRDTSFFFLTGADTIFSMEDWKDPVTIFRSVTILAACRPGVSQEDLKRKIAYLHAMYEADIRLIAVDFVDISSSSIRNAIKEGKSVHGLLPSAVEAYIKEHHFYEKEPFNNPCG